MAAVDVVESPKVQLYVNARPSGSDDPALEKFTLKGAAPLVAEALATAVGGWLTEAELTVIVIPLEAVLLVPSETVTRATYVPAFW